MTVLMSLWNGGNSRNKLPSHGATTHDADLFHRRVVSYCNNVPGSVVLASSALCFQKNACLCYWQCWPWLL